MGDTAKDEVGNHYRRLTVIERAGTHPSRGLATWRCLCSCGKETIVTGTDLRTGDTKSCGCLHDDIVTNRNTTHGLSHLPEYAVWQDLRRRCINPNRGDFERYGGRGIAVCERWDSFENFFEDMGPRPTTKYSIERIDNLLGYSPDNCIWATMTEQARNTRRNRNLTYNGRTQPLVAWAEELDMCYSTLHARLIQLGWSVDRALTEPINR